MVKVEAHRCTQALDPGSQEWVDAKGNDLADSLARQGAALHPHRAGLLERRGAASRVVATMAGWIGTAGAVTSRDRLGTTAHIQQARSTTCEEEKEGERH